MALASVHFRPGLKIIQDRLERFAYYYEKALRRPRLK